MKPTPAVRLTPASIPSRQDVILGRLAEALKGYVVSQSSDWANTGALYIENPRALQVYAHIRYDFQPGYCTLKLWFSGAPAAHLDLHLAYAHPTAVADAIRSIADAIKTHRPLR